MSSLVDIPIRSRLLHEEIASTNVSELLQKKTQSEVLVEISGHLRLEAQKDQPVSDFRDGNIRLFAWILRNHELESLDSFPALTQEPHEDNEAPKTIALIRDAESDVCDGHARSK